MPTGKSFFGQWTLNGTLCCPGGKLYVPGAEKIIPNLKRLVQAAEEFHIFLVSSADAHTPDDPEFKLFPPHCVKGTSGAEIIPEGLLEKSFAIPNDPSFSLPGNFSDFHQVVLEKQSLDVFTNPKTAELVDSFGPNAEYIVFGVVTEYCVLCAAKGLLGKKRNVAVVQDAIETLKPEQGRRTLDELQSLGARLITTSEALALAAAARAEQVI